MQTDLITRIQTLIEKGQSYALDAVATKLEMKITLSTELQAKLDAIKDTPLLEPELFKLIEGRDPSELALSLLTAEDIDKFPGEEVGTFLFMVEQKITEFRDLAGNYKSTPNTKECDLPNFLEARELQKLGQAEQAKKKAFDEANILVRQKALDELEVASQNLADYAYKISGLDAGVLTEWEKTLVITMVYSSALNSAMSLMGKSFGR